MRVGGNRVLKGLVSSWFLAGTLAFATATSTHAPAAAAVASDNPALGHQQAAARPHTTADSRVGDNSAATGETSSTAAAHGSDSHEGEVSVLQLLEHHLCDGYEVELPGFSLHSFTPFRIAGKDMLVSKHVYFLWISGLLLILLGLWARRNYRDGVPRGGLANSIEAIIVFIRDDVVLPNGGPGAVKYLGFFITLFLFILVMNLMGMIPWGSTPSGNISVTATLAGISFIMIHWSGIREHGLFRHFGNLIPHGVPLALYPILLPIEILGMFTKPFALAMRLFANMLAGHAVIATFLALIPVGLIGALAIGSLAVTGSVAIGLLELFVAFLQAYIFTMLTAIFIGGALNPH